MQNSSGQRTVIHTGILPPEAEAAQNQKRESTRGGKRRPKWFTAGGSKPKTRKKAGFSERLLRNTAIACTLLLGILTIRNIDQPWSRTAISGIESALTMRIDPDASLGRLSFVKSIIPESTLVFFNMSGAATVEPVNGDVVHEYSDGQPWTLYSCEPAAEVRSTMSGTVSAVACMESGDWCVMVDHGEGVETMYAYMDKPSVDAGDQVECGETIGAARGESLYYEYRQDGASVAPGQGDAP